MITSDGGGASLEKETTPVGISDEDDKEDEDEEEHMEQGDVVADSAFASGFSNGIESSPLSPFFANEELPGANDDPAWRQLPFPTKSKMSATLTNGLDTVDGDDCSRTSTWRNC